MFVYTYDDIMNSYIPNEQLHNEQLPSLVVVGETAPSCVCDK